MLESGVRWTIRKLTGSHKSGDYCWSVYSGKATADPWYLGGASRETPPSPPAEPAAEKAPEDSGEFEPIK